MNAIFPYLKALFGFLTPGAVVLGSAVTETSQAGTTITSAEWVTAIVACIVTGSLVFAVPNKDPRGTHQEESTQPPGRHERGEAGAYDPLYLVAVALLILVLLVFLFRLA